MVIHELKQANDAAMMGLEDWNNKYPSSMHYFKFREIGLAIQERKADALSLPPSMWYKKYPELANVSVEGKSSYLIYRELNVFKKSK